MAANCGREDCRLIYIYKKVKSHYMYNTTNYNVAAKHHTILGTQYSCALSFTCTPQHEYCPPIGQVSNILVGACTAPARQLNVNFFPAIGNPEAESWTVIPDFLTLSTCNSSKLLISYNKFFIKCFTSCNCSIQFDSLFTL